jgi:hypothetical protein
MREFDQVCARGLVDADEVFNASEVLVTTEMEAPRSQHPSPPATSCWIGHPAGQRTRCHPYPQRAATVQTVLRSAIVRMAQLLGRLG